MGRTVSVCRNVPVITAHAHRRMQQRAIRPEMVQATMLFGREVNASGARFYVVGRREIEQARRHGDRIDDLDGIHVVCSPNGNVVTVYRSRSLRGLHAALRAA